MDTIQQRGVRKKRDGVVVSDAMEKTIVVRVERRMRHPVYGKELTRYKKFYAHDEKNEAHKGDVVRIAETRPLSRLKRWRLVEVLKKGKGELPRSSDDSAQNQS
jgi:small subunit ribosomal protein S17